MPERDARKQQAVQALERFVNSSRMALADAEAAVTKARFDHEAAVWLLEATADQS